MTANSENNACAFKTSIGGQALIEGILMRGPEKQSIVCRLSDGTLKEKVEPIRSSPIAKIPFLRGIPVFISSMANGMKAITYSAEQLPEGRLWPSAFSYCCPPFCSSSFPATSERSIWC